MANPGVIKVFVLVIAQPHAGVEEAVNTADPRGGQHPGRGGAEAGGGSREAGCAAQGSTCAYRHGPGSCMGMPCLGEARGSASVRVRASAAFSLAGQHHDGASWVCNDNASRAVNAEAWVRHHLAQQRLPRRSFLLCATQPERQKTLNVSLACQPGRAGRPPAPG